MKRRSRTGNLGFTIVPQYESYKVTVFVWGKATILKFVGNTKKKSMKYSAVSCCCLQCSQEVS